MSEPLTTLVCSKLPKGELLAAFMKWLRILKVASSLVLMRQASM